MELKCLICRDILRISSNRTFMELKYTAAASATAQAAF